MQSIVRFNDGTSQSVVFTDSASTTGGFNLAVFSGATLLVSATSTGDPVTLTFVTKGKADDADSFVVSSSTNAPVTLEIQPGRAYALPDELFACAYVMATTDAGTATCKVVVKA